MLIVKPLLGGHPLLSWHLERSRRCPSHTTEEAARALFLPTPPPPLRSPSPQESSGELSCRIRHTMWKCSPSSLLNWFGRVRIHDNNKMKPNLSLVHAQNGKQFSRKQKVSESLRNIFCRPEARNVSSLNISSERKWGSTQRKHSFLKE